MADKPSAPISDPINHIKGFFAILAALIFLWFFTGGYDRAISRSGPLLSPPTTIGGKATGYGNTSGNGFRFLPNSINLVPDAGSNTVGKTESSYNNPNAGPGNNTNNQVYTIEQTAVSLKDRIANSSYKNALSIESYGGIGGSNAGQEYVTLRAASTNAEKITLTGWKLKSGVYGGSYDIGTGVYLPYVGSVNPEQPILLAPGERAVIVTGRSPTGISFRENMCTGYLEQFQDFTPGLSFNCPAIRDEQIPADPHGFNNYCLDILNRIPKCTIMTEPFTTQLTPECQRFIVNNVNYTGCLNLHKNEPGFYSSTWRVFLARENKIWQSRREIIELVDPSGKIADAVSF